MAGGVDSDLSRHVSPFLKFLAVSLVQDLMTLGQSDSLPITHVFEQRLFMYPVSLGALTSLYAGTAPESVEFNGKVSLLAPSFLFKILMKFIIVST